MHLHIASCPTAPDPTSLLRWAPTLSRALQLWTLPPYRGGLWRYHMSYGFGSRIPAEVGSGTTTCPMAPELTS
jgi:hypothetical protein